MKNRNQVTIGIHRNKYDILSQKKEAMEDTLKRNISWGTFFLTMVSQRSLNESVAVLHDSESEEVNPEDFKEIPPWVTKDEVEEIVNKAADKIINKLIKNTNSETDEAIKEGDEKAGHRTYFSQPLKSTYKSGAKASGKETQR